ncbi:tetratricopeptide repeat protein [Hyalangium minutum]|uniref:TolA protein n=1 Tax=Hyalangium minutum TaxID=394096 RepID=A0A085WFC0_9BACT|nr:tetratricopeptide repeat protein [Hyalangium minutum]KFE66383.1 TolA protein [Hyalangium minutum]
MATTRATGRETTPVDDEFLNLLYRGGELLAAGKVIEAKDFLERAYAMQPKNEKAQNLLGLTYFKLGQFDRAAELYEQLVRDNPVDATLRVNLGLVYLKTNALKRAVREFEVAVDLSPEHQKAHNYLGLALAQAGEYGRAREHFLLAGSDAMAEKMARTIAGEGFSRPTPAPVAKARGSAELEGSEGGREQGGAPVREAPPPPQIPPVEEISVTEEEPAQAVAPVESQPSQEPVAEAAPGVASPQPPPSAPLAAEEDWGAQFGLDESQPAEDAAAAEAQAAGSAYGVSASASEIPEATEVEFSGAEGPVVATSNASSQAAAEDFPITEEVPPEVSVAPAPVAPLEAEPEMPVLPIEELTLDGLPELTAEPENPEDLAAIAQHEEQPADRTQVAAEAAAPVEAPAEASVEALAEASVEAPLEAPPQPLVEEVAAETPQAQESEVSAQAPVPAEVPAAAVVSVPPEPGAGRVPAGRGFRREGEVPLLGEFAPAMALGGANAETPFTVGAGGLAARVEGELLTRLEGLVAFTGQLLFQPEMKRFRGRMTDKPFGDGFARMVRATGRGTLFIEPGEKRTFQAIDLGDESAYFRDECVFAFEEPVMFENGRVPSDVAPDLDLVHLRGNGKVLLNLAGPLRSVPVTQEEPATVPLTHLVGWQGSLTPRVVSLLQGAEGEILKTAVELSGEGFALLCLPVR